MNKYETILEIAALDKKRQELINEMREFIRTHTQENRTFSDGEIVAVYNGYRGYVCDGIIDGAKVCVRLDSFDIAQYGKDSEKYQKELGDIVYGVKQIKKDGQKSARNVNYRFIQTTKSDYDYYIQKK